MGKGRTYEQWDLDRETLAQMFRVLRKDKQWNTLNKKKRETGTYPRGGGAMLLFVPPLTRSTWRPIMDLIELAESLGFVFYGSLTWDHQIMGMGYDAGRNRKNEILLFTAGKRGGVLWDLGLTNVLRHRRLPRRKGEHEAEKPVELFWELARGVTQAGDVVADFFVGRGRWIQRFLQEGSTWWRWTGRRGGSRRFGRTAGRSGWGDLPQASASSTYPGLRPLINS